MQPGTEDTIWFKRMALIFNEWARLYAIAPEEFDDILDENGEPFADYGDRCAACFSHIATNMDERGLLPLPSQE